jgi:hypothetical protein
MYLVEISLSITRKKLHGNKLRNMHDGVFRQKSPLALAIATEF